MVVIQIDLLLFPNDVTEVGHTVHIQTDFLLFPNDGLGWSYGCHTD